MPQVTVDGVDEEQLAVLVPVVPPGIRRAVADDFDDLAPRMVAPDAALHADALGFRSARLAQVARAGMPTATVEPAVRSPAQAVGEVVVIAFGNREAVESHFGFPVGDIVAIAIRDKQQLRRAHHPNAAAPDLDAG